ncbi:hypothetical protein K7X08_005989 [Anisodus acutangulus]|uniref:LysM domain-containing protein n=1 Tax=Anisodus acutangulus TaxID=402998 RepID=A0A9Q1LSB9_9SOLA|nr:hypothetical protein K7X08_005989 [Anisodus acutangulus]
MVKANNYSVNYLILVLFSCHYLAEFFKGTNIETPDCHGIYAAEAGDTCESLVKIFNLKAEHFSSINPNLNCDKVFVGEWLCVNGTVSN